MRTTYVAAVVASLVFAGCSGGSSEGVTVPLYRGEPNGDGAALVGTFAIDGRCLYLDGPSGTRYLPAFPKEGTKWNDEANEITVGGRVAKPGDQVILGGSENTRLPTTIDWDEGPHSSCDTSKLWMAGASMFVEQ